MIILSQSRASEGEGGCSVNFMISNYSILLENISISSSSTRVIYIMYKHFAFKCNEVAVIIALGLLKLSEQRTRSFLQFFPGHLKHH